jgi:hypothetical protein
MVAALQIHQLVHLRHVVDYHTFLMALLCYVSTSLLAQGTKKIIYQYPLYLDSIGDSILRL